MHMCMLLCVCECAHLSTGGVGFPLWFALLMLLHPPVSPAPPSSRQSSFLSLRCGGAAKPTCTIVGSRANRWCGWRVCCCGVRRCGCDRDATCISGPRRSPASKAAEGSAAVALAFQLALLRKRPLFALAKSCAAAAAAEVPFCRSKSAVGKGAALSTPPPLADRGVCSICAPRDWDGGPNSLAPVPRSQKSKNPNQNFFCAHYKQIMPDAPNISSSMVSGGMDRVCGRSQPGCH